jgi:membrane glycosyltransferase
MMYLGAPAWMLMNLAALWKLLAGETLNIDFVLGVSMFFIMFAVSLFPKIAGWLDIAFRRGGAAAYGGPVRFAAGALTETLFSILLAPAVAVRVTIFLVGLLFGRRIAWSGQIRDAHALSWADAARGLWPQTLFGIGFAWAIWTHAPGAIPWAAPMLAGLIGAIPFAVLTASPGFGRLTVATGLCAIPDEFAPAPELRALAGRLPEPSRSPTLAAE